jgi:hypothetical protein
MRAEHVKNITTDQYISGEVNRHINELPAMVHYAKIHGDNYVYFVNLSNPIIIDALCKKLIELGWYPKIRIGEYGPSLIAYWEKPKTFWEYAKEIFS